MRREADFIFSEGSEGAPSPSTLRRSELVRSTPPGPFGADLRPPFNPAAEREGGRQERAWLGGSMTRHGRSDNHSFYSQHDASLLSRVLRREREKRVVLVRARRSLPPAAIL